MNLLYIKNMFVIYRSLLVATVSRWSARNRTDCYAGYIRAAGSLVTRLSSAMECVEGLGGEYHIIILIVQRIMISILSIKR